VRVPKNAPQTLAEGEFNRYYIRGLCARAIAEGIDEVVVYRGKAVKDPRTESQAKIGKRFNARVLLRDLRNSTGVEPAVLRVNHRFHRPHCRYKIPTREETPC